MEICCISFKQTRLYFLFSWIWPLLFRWFQRSAPSNLFFQLWIFMEMEKQTLSFFQISEYFEFKLFNWALIIACSKIRPYFSWNLMDLWHSEKPLELNTSALYKCFKGLFSGCDLWQYRYWAFDYIYFFLLNCYTWNNYKCNTFLTLDFDWLCVWVFVPAINILSFIASGNIIFVSLCI